ncbi:N-acetylmuramoyl-L-alanine amidase [Endothiovibrio diazotrophicus]
MRTLLFALLAALSGLLHAESVSVAALRLTGEPAASRLELELSAPVAYDSFTLHTPERLVFDLKSVRAVDPEFSVDLHGGVVSGVRSAPRGDGLRVVLDLTGGAKHAATLLPPAGGQGHRLVVEVSALGGGPAEPPEAPTAPAKRAPTAAAKAVAASGGQLRDIVIQPRGPARSAAALSLRDLVIAIDPGHGGKDPGAIGPRGTREKDVVLAIAHRLQRLINDEPGMRATMIRGGDRFIKLRDRIKIARERKADLFISIHADSYRDFGASGSSVYILSPDGASSEAARWLAESENRADLAGGVTLDDKDQMVASVLLDMSQTKTIEESSVAAAEVLKRLKALGKLHSRRVQRAGFAVLKSPDIPSMLVETGFLSNPVEERKLRDPAHQGRIAAAVMDGVRVYFKRYAPPGTWIAEGRRPPPERTVAQAPQRAALLPTRASDPNAPRHHTIRSGDTLFSIARDYQVDVGALRLVNGLKENSIIRVGQRLLIPAVREGV